MSERDWQSMKTAPRDGTEFLAYGYNWGDETKGRHRHVVKWMDERFVGADDEDLTLKHLRGWMPLIDGRPALPPSPIKEG